MSISNREQRLALRKRHSFLIPFLLLFVALAAYGDYAPGYIGTEVSYQQGGYETSPKASLVAPSVEAVTWTP